MLIELLLDCISETMQGIKSPELEPSEEMQGVGYASALVRECVVGYASALVHAF